MLPRHATARLDRERIEKANHGAAQPSQRSRPTTATRVVKYAGPARTFGQRSKRRTSAMPGDDGTRVAEARMERDAEARCDELLPTGAYTPFFSRQFPARSRVARGVLDAETSLNSGGFLP
jgi:hypothetical protein